MVAFVFKFCSDLNETPDPDSTVEICKQILADRGKDQIRGTKIYNKITE